MPSKRQNAGVTIVHIARKLGISAMTVSRALNGNSEVSRETRKKVLRCADDLGYRRNRWARSLVTQKSLIVGIVIPDISHSYFAEVTRGVEEVIEKAGFDLLLCHSNLNPHQENAEVDMLVGSRIEGLIVASEQPENSPQLFLRLRQQRVPFVLVDRYFPKHRLPSVRVDDIEVGRLAADHLLELGHRRIAHIHGPRLSPATLRQRGFEARLRERGAPAGPELIVGGRFDHASGREAMKKLLALDRPPTAVFAGNDPMAVGALNACREAGVAVPGDVSIMGAGNIEGEMAPNPFLTTIDWPRVELGRIAATLLIASIANPDQEPREEVLPPRLLTRQSTAAPHS
jgi:LacI family transcriptional regulator